jgi:hypothetical protein
MINVQQQSGTGSMVRAAVDTVLVIKSRFRDVNGADHADKLRQLPPDIANTQRYDLGTLTGFVHSIAFTLGYNYNSTGHGPSASWLDACQAIRHVLDHATNGYDNDNATDTDRAELYTRAAIDLIPLLNLSR